MNKNYKPINNSFREHWKLHGYLSPEMIEELLDLVDNLERDKTQLEHDNDETHNEVVYWREKLYASGE